MTDDPVDKAFALVRTEIEAAGYGAVEINLFNFCRDLEVIALKDGVYYIARLTQPQRSSWRADAYHGKFDAYPDAGRELAARLTPISKTANP